MRFFIFIFLFLMVSCGSPPTSIVVSPSPVLKANFQESFTAKYIDNKTVISLVCSVENPDKTPVICDLILFGLHEDGTRHELRDKSESHVEKNGLFEFKSESTIESRFTKVLILWAISDIHGKQIDKSFKEITVGSEPTK